MSIEVSGIPLFYPGQMIDFIDFHGDRDSYTTSRVSIDKLGYAHIAGDKGFNYQPYILGFTMIQQLLIIGSAQSLVDRGFFDSGVAIEGVKTGSRIKATMILPIPGIIFRASEIVGEDKMDTNPNTRSYTLLTNWRMNNDSLELRFFTPSNPVQLEQLLYELRFSFKI